MNKLRIDVLVPVLLAAILGGTLALSDSPVADAAMRDDVAAVRVLLADGADVNTPRGDGMTGLHWAALNGNAEIAHLLIGAGADLEAATRLGAHTPLHVAAKQGHGAIVEILARAGADVATVTETGATPLHFAAASGNVPAITALIEHGAPVDATEPEWGQTPLMFASAMGRTKAVAALLEGGADAAIAARVMDLVERDIMDRASERTRRTEIAAMRGGADAQSYPVESGVSGATPQASAAPLTAREEQAREATQEALEARRQTGEPVPLNYADLVGQHGGLTAIHLAAREGHTASVMALLDGGVDIDLPSVADGTTPMLMGGDQRLLRISWPTSLSAAPTPIWPATQAPHPCTPS